jgi:hypothetical protein
MAFIVEIIPDESRLFRRINEIHCNGDGTVSSAAFNDSQMSVNWERYSDAASAADENSGAVASLLAGEYRGVEQLVVHCPTEPDQPFGPNRSHSEVRGKKTKSLRRKLSDMVTIVWRKQ